MIDSRSFDRWLAVFDTVGLAAFTVVGAKVALIADLAWYWVPICAALTCAGGGMLLAYGIVAALFFQISRALVTFQCARDLEDLLLPFRQHVFGSGPAA